LAYKGVRDDYTDWYSGRFSNNIGEVLEMNRNQVCDDANLGCSSGFHAGTHDYAKGYGDGGHLMMVEISPTDVVSVPHDSDCQKLRVCKYEVHSKCEGKIKAHFVEDEDEDEDDDEDGDILQEEYNSGYKAGIEDAKKQFSGNSDNPKTAKTMTVAALQAAKQKRGNNGRFC
jgi:hypothetical protein